MRKYKIYEGISFVRSKLPLMPDVTFKCSYTLQPKTKLALSQSRSPRIRHNLGLVAKYEIVRGSFRFCAIISANSLRS